MSMTTFLPNVFNYLEGITLSNQTQNELLYHSKLERKNTLFSTRKLRCLEKDEIALHWKLLDREDDEEVILRQNFSVIAWRYLSTGEKSFLKIIEEYNAR